MASDEEDETLAHFLESEVLSELCDQEEWDMMENEDEREKERHGKRSRIEEGKLCDQEVNEYQEAKKVKTAHDEVSGVGSSRALRLSLSSSSPEFTSEIEESSTKIDIVIGNNNCDGRRCTENIQFPRRIETGIFSQIPPELLYHILKFLSSEDLISCLLVCKFLSFAASDESLWRRLCGNVHGRSFISSVMKKIWQSLFGLAHLNSKNITSKCKSPREVKHLIFLR